MATIPYTLSSRTLGSRTPSVPLLAHCVPAPNQSIALEYRPGMNGLDVLASLPWLLVVELMTASIGQELSALHREFHSTSTSSSALCSFIFFLIIIDESCCPQVLGPATLYSSSPLNNRHIEKKLQLLFEPRRIRISSDTEESRHEQTEALY